MSNRTSTARLKQDYLRLKRDPVPYISAEPLPANILEWHYVVRGPKESPYYGGYYHGHLVFPSEFPFKPPAIYMRTPNGRFKTNTRLCLSISDFHPDTWNPAWSVATILTGLLSFMLEQTPTYGSTVASVAERKQMARESLGFNLRNELFCELFPDVVAEMWTSLGYVPSEPIVDDSSPNNRSSSGSSSRSRNQRHLSSASSSSRKVNKSQPRQAETNAKVDDGNAITGQLQPPPGWVPLNAVQAPPGGVDEVAPVDGAAAAARFGGDVDNWHSVLSNVLVLAGFAIFAYVANHVFRSISQE